MKLFKITEQDGTTYNHSTLWGAGVTHSIKPKGNPQLCSSDVLHAYSNLNLAILLNPIHANISNPLIWEASGEVAVKDFGKVGCFSLTTNKLIKPPKWLEVKADPGTTSLAQQIQIMFAILCAESVLDLYEKANSNDAPRKAIEAAKEYLKVINTDAAARVAARAAAGARVAARAAADAAAAYVAYAAADAAGARVAYAARAAGARVAARAAADAAADAAGYAGYAGYAAAAAASADADAAASADAGGGARAGAAARAAASADAAARAAADANQSEINFGELADKAVEIIMNGGLK